MTDPLDHDALLADQQESAQRIAALQESDLRTVLAVPAARRFLREVIFKRCRLVRSTFHEDPRIDAVCQGERNVGIWLLAELSRVDPAAIVTLLNTQDLTEEATP
jgi:hypothetical protein